MAGCAVQRGQCDGRRGVAALGFEHVVDRGSPGHLRQQAAAEMVVFVVGHEQQFVRATGLPPGDGLLQERAAAEVEKGFGIGLA